MRARGCRNSWQNVSPPNPAPNTIMCARSVSVPMGMNVAGLDKLGRKNQWCGGRVAAAYFACLRRGRQENSKAMDIIAELQWRGLLADCTDLAELSKRLASGPTTLYCGFDP